MILVHEIWPKCGQGEGVKNPENFVDVLYVWSPSRFVPLCTGQQEQTSPNHIAPVVHKFLQWKLIFILKEVNLRVRNVRISFHQRYSSVPQFPVLRAFLLTSIC